jgi:uncharacterized protein (DUF2126 family)
MGGEPTFVPFQPEGAEWSTAALGPTKLLYARRFARAMLELYYPGALVTQSYGKQYPGEILPRWNLVIHIHPEKKLWRKPQRLLLGEPLPQESLASMKKVMGRLATRLHLQDRVRPAVEVDDDKKIKGWILPLAYEKKKWVSASWKLSGKGKGQGQGLRSGIPLIPGDSSIGLRLPLNELPEATLKRALTVEMKDGGLEIFFPPLEPQPYLELIRLVEKVADEMDLKGLILSGYQPKEDLGLERYVLASDPGVIEVNLPPSREWSVYQRQLEQLYRAAEQAELCAHKLHYNGRMLGSGGGAHLCFGGPQPLLSPVFQVPDFLPAVITYWQNHPALSYVFSGQFVGPGSQAPRVDEAMSTVLSELELAFRGVHHFKNRPDLYAMLFRDMLSDASGNTHRAEISIDKLWNTQHTNTMLGILEFRAFEAFPDARSMSVIGLFIRSILAMLLQQPKLRSFKSWGSSLHDLFFLPSHLRQDLSVICADLQQQGIPFSVEWLQLILDFRFPVIGTFPEEKGMQIRHAIEAWPLLSEQPLAGGTARLVDSSTERLEISLDSPALLRDHFLLVNGWPLAFQTRHGLASAGLRFRAFHVLPALHPHVPVQTPLLFEWINRRTRRVEQAAEWSTWLPDGQSYCGRPQNLEEAAVRFAERWKNRPDRLGQKVAGLKHEPKSEKCSLDLRYLIK